MNVSLRQLRLFEATARLGRLTQAANEQAISQSAASQGIKELENILGYSLFRRVGRELVLTDQGQQILPRVRRILSLAESLVEPDVEKVSGPLRVVSSVTIASYLLPKLLASYIRQYPEVVPALEIHNTRAVINHLEKGQAHFGMIEGPALHHRLDIVAWRTDELALFCSPDHPLAQPGVVPESQLADQRWVVREAGSGTRAVFDTAFQAAKIRPQLVLELSRQEAIKQSVRAGLGIGCLSELSIQDEIRDGRLVRLKTGLDLTRQFSWVCPPENRQIPQVRAFIELLDRV